MPSTAPFKNDFKIKAMPLTDVKHYNRNPYRPTELQRQDPDISFKNRHSMPVPVIIAEKVDSDEEFYDALENTQALNEAQEREMLNSPVFRLADKFSNQGKPRAN